MSQLEDRLSSLLSDDEGRQQIIKLAAMLGGSSSSGRTDKQDTDGAEEPPVFNTEEPSQASSGNDKTSAIFAALPNLLQAMSGSGEGLDSKKVNLIQAISPYLNSSRSEYIERAIRMASVAKAARDTLGILGR